MLRSMTAFARTEQAYEFGSLVWELRSVNHRYLDVGLRLPEDLRSLEQSVREKMASRLKRGKVDAALRYKLTSQTVPTIEIDEAFMKSLVDVGNRVGELLGSATTVDPFSILRWPGVIKEQEPDWTPLEQAAARQLDMTLEQLVTAREREGQRIDEMLQQRCTAVSEIVSNVRQRRPEVLQYIRAKVEGRIKDLQIQVDQNRLEQELVMIAQRMDVDEELDRLDSHVVELQQALTEDEPTGRRLDFLMQEFNREANTLSSKSADAVTTKSAVELKVLIEQMREQIQNIE